MSVSVWPQIITNFQQVHDVYKCIHMNTQHHIKATPAALACGLCPSETLKYLQRLQSQDTIGI